MLNRRKNLQSTIFDVAKAAGVSSQRFGVLNGESGVKEATREAVERAIRESLNIRRVIWRRVFAQARQRRLRWSCRNIRISFIMSFSGA